MEEAALQKSNTDCVYFLASPLTCKKGMECEYRHSEIARLNPRDCWYWLAGSCLNPTCAFRHPPLDGRTEAASESASADHQSAVTANKTNVPCYYYYNGFCNKGERCLFVHRPEENMYTWKSSKEDSVVVGGLPLEKKMSIGSDSGYAPADIQFGGPDFKSKAEPEVFPQQESHHNSAPNNAAEQSVPPQISESPSEEAATFRSNSPIHTEGLFDGRSLELTDQGLGDKLDEYIEQEEWLDSPGFDVLVNDRSEDLDYVDEAPYLLHHDMEGRECNDQRLAYCEDNIEYDPSYPDIRVSFEQGMPDWYDHEKEDVCNTTWKTPFPASERVLHRTLPQKRKLLHTELAGTDLRDYLKRRRMAKSQHTKYISGRTQASHLIGKIKEKASIGGTGHLHRRLASKVEIAVESRIETERRLRSAYHLGRRKQPRTNRSRQQTKEKKQVKRQNLSDVSGKTASRKWRTAEEPTVFTGPKTLAQIKEEKKKALGDTDFSERRGPSSSDA